MRLAALDRRVRKEAQALLTEAKRGVGRGKLSVNVTDELRTRAAAVEVALSAGDLRQVRAVLPALDAVVEDHLVPGRKSTGREYGESIAIAIIIALLLRSFVIEAFKIPSASMIPTMLIGDHIFVNKFIYGLRIPFTKTKLFEWRQPARGEVIVFMNPCTPEKDFIKRVVATAGDSVEVRCDILYVNGVAVPAELETGKQCHYWDFHEENQTWSEETECSRYQETVHGHAYVTQHDEQRVEDDRRRAEAGPRSPYIPAAHDFPREIPPSPSLEGYSAEMRCIGDERTPEEAARSVGTFDWSVAPGVEPDACAPRFHYVVPAGHVFVMGDNRDNSSDSRSWGPVPLGHIKGKALFIWWSHGAHEGVRLSRMGDLVR